MKIKFIDKNEVDSVYDFNKLVFPVKHSDGKLLDFWFGKNKNETSISVILKGDSDEILGQALYSSMNYFYKEELSEGEWFYDYIIREDKRRCGYGIDILTFVANNKVKYIYSIGAGPLSLKIHFKMGFRVIGELKKYVGIGNPFFFLTSLFRGVIPLKKYPEKVFVKDSSFYLLGKEELPYLKDSYNKDILEFGRENDYLKWRFFSGFHDYAFYKLGTGSDYFVLRTIIKKKITCLVLVDYRCSFGNKENFSNIIKAIKKIAGKLCLGLIITGSSLKEADSVLEKNHFRAVGRNRPINATQLFQDESEIIAARQFVFVTLADVDGELGW